MTYRQFVGGKPGGDDSRIMVSESSVTKVWDNEIAGYDFNPGTRAMVEVFAACRHASRRAERGGQSHSLRKPRHEAR